MATKFMEPGGDATFNAGIITTGGFWNTPTNTTIATDFVHGGHIKSLKYAPATQVYDIVSGAAADAGGRISVYYYFVALPTATASILSTEHAGDGAGILRVQITTAGVLQMATGDVKTQIGTNGSTIPLNQWFRLCLAWTITNSTTNQIRLYKDSQLDISIGNATLSNTAGVDIQIGLGNGADTTIDFRTSDHYADNSTALTDIGDVMVTAKRPNANGTTNGFTTQIGSGGSGYGSGHSPQVNERALSTTNGWSMVGAGAAITEEYNIESASTGDINITGQVIVDYAGWAYASSLANETASLVLNNVTSNIALTSTQTMFTAFAGSTTYPAGTGTDIGIVTTTALTTVSLYECGIMIAYIFGAPVPPFTNKKLQAFQLLGVGT